MVRPGRFSTLFARCVDVVRARWKPSPMLYVRTGDMQTPLELEPTIADVDFHALKRRSVYGSAATFVAQGCRFLLKFAAQIFIARLLLPADYGLVAMVAPILALTYLVGELGLGQAVILRRDLALADVSALFWFCLLLNLGLAAVLPFLSPPISSP